MSECCKCLCITFVVLTFLGLTIFGCVDYFVKYENRFLHYLAKFGLFFFRLACYSVTIGTLVLIMEQMHKPCAKKIKSLKKEVEIVTDYTKYKLTLIFILLLSFAFYTIMGTVWFLQMYFYRHDPAAWFLSLINISEPTRQAEISYAVFCLKKKK
eukprot:TRINITY_DN4104_c0_g1_i3.p1 TRINITY_DN4104_c0_g1~~TRINITY_DN4104_c0_g1_i3.p1  ORF type:complete len:155 (+),score=19.53 TRINITY_DN4104_c0_g1_i3:131-595(+)